MATGTGMISAQTQGVNPPLLIRSNLEKVAAIAGAVASFALAIFALIGSEYLVAALSAAAGLSILYAFMKGEGTPAAPTTTTAPIVTQPAGTTTATSSSATAQTTLTAQPDPLAAATSLLQTLPLPGLPSSSSSSRTSVEELERRSDPALPLESFTSATTATSSTDQAAVPVPNSLLPPVPAANPAAMHEDEGSFLRRRSPDQRQSPVPRAIIFDDQPPEVHQSSDTSGVGTSTTSSSISAAPSPGSKHRRSKSDAPRPSYAFEQLAALGATPSGEGRPRPLLAVRGLLMAGGNLNPFTQMLAKSSAFTEELPEGGSPIKIEPQAILELHDILSDDILSEVGVNHLDKPRDNTRGGATTETRSSAVSHDEPTSPDHMDLQGLGSELEIEPVGVGTGAATTSDGNGFTTPPPVRRPVPAAVSIATRPQTGTPALGQGGNFAFSDFLRSTSKNPSALPRSPSNPDLKQMSAFRALGANPVGMMTAASFGNRFVQKLDTTDAGKKQ